jgi:hypothetical protein
MKVLTLLTLMVLGGVTLAQNQSSIDFDGVDDRVYVGNSADFEITNHITLEAWVKADNQLAPFNRFIDKFNYVDEQGYNLILNGGHLFMEFFDTSTASKNVYGSALIDDDLWHHVAGTYDGNELRIYVDGALDNSKIVGNVVISVSSNPLMIGNGHDGQNYLPLKGRLDEVRIWNVARDSSQIARYRDSCLHGDEPGLVGYWRFDENSDSIAYDLTGNGNHGMLRYGAAWNSDVGFTANCPPVGVADLSDAPDLMVLPNPVADLSEVDLQGAPGVMRIYDSLGRLCKISLVRDRGCIRRADYQPGVYLLTLTTFDGQVETNRFVIQ